MSSLKKSFRWYPSKLKRPTIRSVVIGGLIDFSIPLLGALVWVVQLLLEDTSPYLYERNLRLAFIVISIGIIYGLIIETAISWATYTVAKHRGRNK